MESVGLTLLAGAFFGALTVFVIMRIRERGLTKKFTETIDRLKSGIEEKVKR